MQISIDEIRQKFTELISGSVSRESISDWALSRRKAEDDGQLEYVPPSDESKIWDAILYLWGVDSKVSPTEYLHCEDDFRTYVEERLQD